MAMVTIDNVGQRYGMLPSEVMRRADTFDLKVLDAAIKYEAYKREEAQAIADGTHTTSFDQAHSQLKNDNPSEDDMIEMVRAAKASLKPKD